MTTDSFNKPDITVAPISLPVSDMVAGLGEEFSVDAFRGSGSLSIPIDTSQARGFEPQISLTYGSGGGNGPAGLGFSLEPGSVSRSTSGGIPRYTEEDRFVLSTSGALVPLEGGSRTIQVGGASYQVTQYLPDLLRTTERIERWVRTTDGDTVWRWVQPDGTLSLFGLNASGRIFDPAAPSRVFEWLLQMQYDTKGNAIRYDYLAEDGANLGRNVWERNRQQKAQKYLKSIRYGCKEPYSPPPYGIGPPPDIGWHIEILLDYGQYNPLPTNPAPYVPTGTWSARQDPFSSYDAGFEIRTHRLLRHIMLFHRFDALGPDPELVHLWRLIYNENPVASQLARFDSLGYKPNPDKSSGKDPYVVAPLPPLEFTYTSFDATLGEFEPIEAEAGETLPGLTIPPYMLVDLQGQGVPGILYADGETVLYWPPAASEKPTFAPAQALEHFPIVGRGGPAAAQFMDVTGDGRVDVVVADSGTAGFYENLSGGRWAPLRLFSCTPSDFMSLDASFADLSGDGRDDLVTLGKSSLRYYRSEGASGFGTPEVRVTSSDMPSSIGSTPDAKIVFADLFGTGQTHLVRVTNGSVECWPNLGYGVFGDKVTLGNAPHLESDFDASRFTVADLTGTGGADLLYTMSDRVLIFQNLGGNSFAEGVSIPLPAVLSSPAQVTIADLGGTGMPSILVALLDGTPRHLSLALNGGLKPYLLSNINNNSGATTEITYGGSAQFWLHDVRAGLPWITSLPFPVTVVTKVVRNDLISQCAMRETYSYHHGYFDGEAHEFRGFGYVERSEAEQFELFEADAGLSRGPREDANLRGAEQVTLLIKTWFHTGAYLAEEALEAQYRREWFHGDPNTYSMPGPTFDWGGPVPDDVATLRMAHAALRGHVLHSEIYSLDGSDAQSLPYRVVDTAQMVRLVPPMNTRGRPVFLVYDRETLLYNYERNPVDPAVAHEFILEVDQYGQVTRTCTVAYGRRAGQPGSLAVQERPLATCDRYSYINLDQGEVFRIGIPWQLITHEVLDLQEPADGYFSWDNIDTLIRSASLTEDQPLTTIKGWHQYLYYSEDGTTPAPEGHAGKQALLRTEQSVAFAAADIKALFEPVLSANELKTKLIAAHYFLDASETYWWMPAQVETYFPATEFYLPKTTSDKFGSTTTYAYDATSFALLSVLTSATGLIDSEISVSLFDYHSLQPVKVTDANKQVGEVLLDALGQVIVSTHYKDSGDEPGFHKITSQVCPVPADLDEVIADPDAFLNGWAEYCYYDPLSWSGRVQVSRLGELHLDGNALLAALAESGYITPEGVLLYKFRALTGGEALVLPPPYGTRRTEIYDQVAAVLTDQPANWLRLTAQDYPGGSTPPQIRLAYVDGSERVVQTKARVEPGLALVTSRGRQHLPRHNQADFIKAQVSHRWVTSDAVRYNGSGQIAMEYEPFFVDSYWFLDNEVLASSGVADVYGYDGLDRLVLLNTPDGFFSKTELCAWSTTHFDAVDTVKDSIYYKEHPDGLGLDQYEKEALQQAMLSYNTPTTYMLDPLQNVIARVEMNNRVIDPAAFEALGLDTQHSVELYGELRTNGFLNFLGGLTIAFQPGEAGFSLDLSAQFSTYEATVIDMLQGLEGGGVPLTSRYGRDIMGNQVWAADPRLVAGWPPEGEGQKNLETAYALTGEVLKNIGADAGTIWRLEDISGREIYLRDARGYVTQTSYDPLRRRSAVNVTSPSGTTWTAQAYFYGDQFENGQPIVSDPQAKNLMGRLFRVFEPGGMREFNLYSLGGLPVEMVQKFLLDPAAVPDWTVANAVPNSPLLETGEWLSTRHYNAVSNLVRAYGQNTDFHAIYVWDYRADGLVASTQLVEPLHNGFAAFQVNEYTAQGQRATVGYGSGVVVDYTYDPKTFRLKNLVAKRFGDGVVLQDLHYVYDPVGNVTHCGDRAFNALFGDDSGASPDRDYVYDALYRLIEATGPELAAYSPDNELQPGYEGLIVPQVSGTLPAGSLTNGSWQNAYDSGGNLFWTEHTAGVSSPWTQEMVLSVSSNRAVSGELFGASAGTPVGAPEERTASAAEIDAFFDAVGNQVELENEAAMVWDYQSNLAQATVPAGEGERTTLVLNHDSLDLAVRRVASTPSGGGTQKSDTLYMDGLVVETTTGAGQPTAKSYRIQLMDGELLVAELLVDPLEPNASISYALGDLTMSVALRTDGEGALLNYESYTPYGATAFVVAPNLSDLDVKQERFQQKPRDRMTSLYDFGRRLFAPWLRRWLSPDPSGDVDGLNLFAFVGGNPISFLDLDGRTKKGASPRPKRASTPAPKDVISIQRRVINKMKPRDIYKQLYATAREIQDYWQGGNGAARATSSTSGSKEVTVEEGQNWWKTAFDKRIMGDTAAGIGTKVDTVTIDEPAADLKTTFYEKPKGYGQLVTSARVKDKARPTKATSSRSKKRPKKAAASRYKKLPTKYAQLSPQGNKARTAGLMKRVLKQPNFNSKKVLEAWNQLSENNRALLPVMIMSETSRSIMAPLIEYSTLYRVEHGRLTMEKAFKGREPAFGGALAPGGARALYTPEQEARGLKVTRPATAGVTKAQADNLRKTMLLLAKRRKFRNARTQKEIFRALDQRFKARFRDRSRSTATSVSATVGSQSTTTSASDTVWSRRRKKTNRV